jgi:hypothetical protein
MVIAFLFYHWMKFKFLHEILSTYNSIGDHIWGFICYEDFLKIDSECPQINFIGFEPLTRLDPIRLSNVIIWFKF